MYDWLLFNKSPVTVNGALAADILLMLNWARLDRSVSPRRSARDVAAVAKAHVQCCSACSPDRSITDFAHCWSLISLCANRYGPPLVLPVHVFDYIVCQSRFHISTTIHFWSSPNFTFWMIRARCQRTRDHGTKFRRRPDIRRYFLI